MSKYKISITETGRGNLNEKPQTFSEDIQHVDTLEKVREFLIDRYGRMPNGRNKIYRDIKGKSVVCGFLHSFWNKDWSHNSKKWYQTDWICISEVVETPVLINKQGGFYQEKIIVTLPK